MTDWRNFDSEREQKYFGIQNEIVDGLRFCSNNPGIRKDVISSLCEGAKSGKITIYYNDEHEVFVKKFEPLQFGN